MMALGRQSSRATALVALVGAATMASAQSTGSSNPTSGGSTSTVLLALAINAAIAAGMVTAFIILRPRFPKIYRPKSFLGPKEERVEPLPDSLFGWIMPFYKRPSKAIIESNGLDAYMFVNYIEMMIWILGPIFIFTWILLLPVYAASTSGDKTGFQLLTFGQVGNGPTEQKRYVAPLLAQWVITFWICWIVRKYVLNFIKLRQDFIVSPRHASTAQARTLLITGIPNDFLGEQKLKELYSHMPGGVERVWLNRDLKELPDIFDERTKALNKLEATESKIIKTAYKKVKKNKVAEGGMEADDAVDRYLTKKERPTMKVGAKLGCLGGQKVDAVEHLRSDIERLNKELASRRGDETDYTPANAAFLLFRTQVGCHMAKNMTVHHEPYKMARRYIEAHPDAVIWPNLSMNPYAQKIRTAAFWALTFVFIGVWLPLIAFTAIVSNLNGLCTEVPFLSWVCLIPKPALGIIQGFLPTILLAVLNILLPIILRLFARLSGLPTRTEVELSLQQRMTWFNLIDNFLLFTIISGVSGGISRIVPILSNPSGLPSLISQYIPLANIFYISFIILQALSGAGGGLLQVAGLVIYYIKAFLLGSTPRKVWHIHHDVGAPAWGTLFPAITLITTVTFGYAVLAPLINGFAFVAFILFFILYKYTATYVWDMKPANETSGLFFMQAINASMAGLYVSQLILTVLFFTAQQRNADGTSSQSSIPEGVFMIILMVLTVAFHIVLFDSVGDLPTALPLTLLPAASSSSYSDHATGSHGAYGNDGYSPNEKQHALRQSESTAYGGSNPAAPAVPATGVNVTHGARPPVNGNGQYGNGGAPTKTMGSEGGDDGASEDTFLHPALRDPQRTVWLPRDRFGLSAHAVNRAREHGIDATDEGTGFNEKNRIETDVYVPPGEKML
ncbi:DUF221-domain-containing protein [Jaminaea rosea]|uniref:DUF221-domain-containing protein n=1 Tax=Jaminaea rosea TaxID=1569628 RepID=A0A316UYH9_9BASI|nr:DUF221-domain-containing protein [Jaminaea rosea]PWN30272.1 DUF221-domain-containing protein [Jaminaea rosea]